MDQSERKLVLQHVMWLFCCNTSRLLLLTKVRFWFGVPFSKSTVVDTLINLELRSAMCVSDIRMDWFVDAWRISVLYVITSAICMREMAWETMSLGRLDAGVDHELAGPSGTNIEAGQLPLSLMLFPSTGTVASNGSLVDAEEAIIQ
ncbi:hypothetical protein L1987_44289 [Smallanthus sonchifolius]|uniref:Uncharacterized protein n=1 Tax=Smallanthus sonchifolius TaxID=185202 RepID=A0ACB9GQ34_9ASTR|nr:hypothetical protein L1987_44289 [Smallanthus sonchifolius]